jgi:hypothetical protein
VSITLDGKSPALATGFAVAALVSLALFLLAIPAISIHSWWKGIAQPSPAHGRESRAEIAQRKQRNVAAVVEDLKVRALFGLFGILSLLMVGGGLWAVMAGYEWASSRVSEYRCERALNQDMERDHPEADAHVEHCKIGVASLQGADLCFVNGLDNGIRKTTPVTLSCKRLIGGEALEAAVANPM